MSLLVAHIILEFKQVLKRGVSPSFKFPPLPLGKGNGTQGIGLVSFPLINLPVLLV
jgi:hypothetical protein